MPDADVASVAGVPVAQACADLLDLLAGVSDGRSSQGRDHPTAVVLSLVAAATVAGMTGYTAMAGWVADVPQPALTDLYLRAGVLPAGRPSRSTLWRVCADTDPQALDTAIGAWTTARRSGRDLVAEASPGNDAAPAPAPADLVRLDGKTVCGAVDADGQQLHLLAALAGGVEPGTPAVVIGQVDVAGAKTNEPARARDLLETLDLDGRTVTADALHTVKATAELIHSCGGRFVFPVKENRRTLFDALNTLPWPDTPVAASRIDTSHGRTTRRTIQVLPAPADLPFPHVNQVWLIERYVTDTTGGHLRAAAQLGVGQPHPRTGHTCPDRGLQPGPLGYRIAALDQRHLLPRRRQPSPYPKRTPRPSLHAQPRHQRPPPGRTLRHHRSHPLGQPQHDQALHHPRPHIMILKRP